MSKDWQESGHVYEQRVLADIFYLALTNISRKWTMPLRDWQAALTRLTIMFEEQMPSR
jgi:transposase-like protein